MLVALLACTSAPPEPLVVLAASSFTEVLPEIGRAWQETGGAPPTFGFDASSKLARQVEAGAPADLLFFADAESMDAVAGLLAPGTRRNVAGNTLVVVTPASALEGALTIETLPSVTHLAIAGENVPAGRYAREALQAAGIWTAVEPGVVTGDNVFLAFCDGPAGRAIFARAGFLPPPADP